MKLESTPLARALAQFQDTWAPRTIARVNDYDVRVVKTKGAFSWHAHPDTDELFLVLSGTLHIALEEGTVRLDAGELYVVPRGVRHRPWSDDDAGAEVLLFEPSSVENTGDSPGALTAPRRVLE